MLQRGGCGRDKQIPRTLCESWREEGSVIKSRGCGVGQSGCELGFLVSHGNKNRHTKSRIGRERLRASLGLTVGKQGQAQSPRARNGMAIGLRGEDDYPYQTGKL